MTPRFSKKIFAIALFIACGSAFAADDWKLTWSDEFDGAAIDRAKWGFDRGNSIVVPETHAVISGWGNNELEFYTDSSQNAFVTNGELHIRAIKEQYDRWNYTSARLQTKGKFSQQFGRFEFRAKLPVGRGLWPALWLLPAENSYGGWAASGEFDIMEARGQEPGKVLGTLHYGAKWPANVHTGADYIFTNKTDIGEFHVYALEWEPGEVRWLVDGQVYETQNKWWSSSKVNARNEGVAPKSDADKNPFPAPFDKPFYIVMNLAVGGQFLGKPDAATQFPADLIVDYVRVYERANKK